MNEGNGAAKCLGGSNCSHLGITGCIWMLEISVRKINGSYWDASYIYIYIILVVVDDFWERPQYICDYLW